MLSSCHKGYDVKGRVTDRLTGEPIGQAEVFLKTIDTVMTDSSGAFEFDKYLSGGHAFSDVEILIEKEGFKSKYVNISKTRNTGEAGFSLDQGENRNRFSPVGVKLFYVINLGLSLLNLLTIMFILFKHIRYKFLWIFGIIVINCVFRIIYVDGSVTFDFFHGPFFLLHYTYYPFTIKMVLPIVTICFWLLYSKKVLAYASKDQLN